MPCVCGHLDSGLWNGRSRLVRHSAP
jgi:hypothetical protein